ncbi:MAG: hypothetical protein L0H38_02790 [bacterium]|nr:hypothetical protein [bacterium]
MATKRKSLPKLKSSLRHIPECGYVPMSIVQDTPFVDGYTDEELANRNISVYSHMVHNRYNSDPTGKMSKNDRLAKEHWYLNNTVSQWNVAVEVGTRISGPDAEKFANMLTSQDLTKCSPGQGKYTPILNNAGGIINDPVMYRLGEQEFLFTSSDSDMQRIAEDFLDGLRAGGMELDATVDMPDVGMIQVQGPRAIDVMRDLLGEEDFMSDERYIPYYWFTECVKEDGKYTPAPGSKVWREVRLPSGGVAEIATPRTGFSRLPGFETIVRDVSNVGAEFWKTLLAVVRKHGGDHIGPGHTTRIPGGILSFGNDMTRDGKTTPVEVYTDDNQLNRIVPASKEAWYRGKEAIARMRAEGPQRRLVGIRIMGEPLGWYNDGSMSRNWQVYDRQDVVMLPSGTTVRDDGLVYYANGRAFRDSTGDQLTKLQAVQIDFGRPDLLGRVYVLPETSEKLGDVTSACWSPENEINIARGFVPTELSDVGTHLTVRTEWGLRDAVVVPMPYVPEKVSFDK